MVAATQQDTTIRKLEPDEMAALSQQVIARGQFIECQLLFQVALAVEGFRLAMCRAEEAERSEGEMVMKLRNLQRVVQEVPTAKSKRTKDVLEAALKLIGELVDEGLGE